MKKDLFFFLTENQEPYIVITTTQCNSTKEFSVFIETNKTLELTSKAIRNGVVLIKNDIGVTCLSIDDGEIMVYIVSVPMQNGTMTGTITVAECDTSVKSHAFSGNYTDVNDTEFWVRELNRRLKVALKGKM